MQIELIKEPSIFKGIDWKDVEDKKLIPPYISKVKWVYNNLSQIVNSSHDMIMLYEEKKDAYKISHTPPRNRL